MTNLATSPTRTPLREPPRPLAWRSWPIRDERPWPWNNSARNYIAQSGEARNSEAQESSGRWPPTISGIAAYFPYAMLGITGLVVQFATESILKTLVSLTIVLICLWRWYVPVRFEVNSQGITFTIVGRRRRIPWSAIGHYEIQRHGVFFLPRSRTPLDRLRGLYIPFDPERQLPSVVQHYLDPWIGR